MGRQRIGKSRFGTAADPLLSADQHAAKRRYCLYDRCRQIEKHTDSIRTVVARTDRRNLEPAPRTTRTGTVEDQNEHRIGYAELQRTDPCRDRRRTIRKRFGNLPEIGRRSREQRTIATGDRRTKRRGRHHRSESADRDPVECRCADRPVHALRHLYESAPELAGSRTDRPRPLPPDQRHESRNRRRQHEPDGTVRDPQPGRHHHRVRLGIDPDESRPADQLDSGSRLDAADAAVVRRRRCSSSCRPRPSTR